MKKHDHVFYDTPGLIRRAQIVTLHRDGTVTIRRGEALDVRTGEALPGGPCGGLARISCDLIKRDFVVQS